MADASAGAAPSIGDNPAFYTTLEAVDLPDALLRAAWAFDSRTAETGTVESHEGEIAPYPIVLLADLADSAAQYVVIVLAFEDAALAENAIETVVSRLETVRSQLRCARWADVVVERGAVLQTPRVFTSATTGHSAAVFTFRYPLPSDEINEAGFFTASGVFCTNLLHHFLARDMAWLAVTP